MSSDSAAKPGTSSWTIASDARLKYVSGSFQRGLDALLNLQPVRFRYRAGNALGPPEIKEYVGILAQEVQKAVPEAVSTDSQGYLHLNTDAVFWTLVNGARELSAQNAELQEECIRLREEKDALEERVERLEKLMEGQVAKP